MSNTVNSVLAALHTAFAAVHGPASALISNVGAIIGNRPEPARNVALAALVTVALMWAALKIATRKKASK